MGSGMELAYQLAVGQVQRGTTTRVIVLTDGDTNIGPNLRPEQMLASVHAHVEEGVTLTTVGFGMGNYQGDALEQLADKGNGQALYVDSEQAIERAFRQQLTGTLEVIAKDVKVQVTFDPKVVSTYRLIGYENRAIADAGLQQRQGRRGRDRLGPRGDRAVRGDAHLGSRRAGHRWRCAGSCPTRSEIFEVSQPITARGRLVRARRRGAATCASPRRWRSGADTLRGNAIGSWSLYGHRRPRRARRREGRADRVEFVAMLRKAQSLKSRPVAQANYQYDNSGY